MTKKEISFSRLLSEIQVFRTNRARAGENPCYFSPDPILEVKHDLARIKAVEARRRQQMMKVLNSSIK